MRGLLSYIDVANVSELKLCFRLLTLVNVVMVLKFSDVQQRHLQSGYESTYGSGILSNVNFKTVVLFWVVSRSLSTSAMLSSPPCAFELVLSGGVGYGNRLLQAALGFHLLLHSCPSFSDMMFRFMLNRFGPH